MRATIIILAIVQLLLRGVAVPHSHAHECLSSEAGHAERPHIHVTGDSHASVHNVDKHGHSHHHDKHNESPVQNVPVPDHDQSAFYVGYDVVTSAVERLELPAADGNSVLYSDFDRLADSVLQQTVAYSETWVAEGSIFAPLVVFPHMLRL